MQALNMQPYNVKAKISRLVFPFYAIEKVSYFCKIPPRGCLHEGEAIQALGRS